MLSALRQQQVALLLKVAREEAELRAPALAPVSRRRTEPHAQLGPQVDVGSAAADDAPVSGVVNLDQKSGDP